MQTLNLSQAPRACLCKILLVRVKCFTIHTLFLSQFGLVCVQILGVELTRVSLHYTLGVSTTLHATLGLFTLEKIIEAKYTLKKLNLFTSPSFTLFCCHLAFIEIYALLGEF